MPRDASGDGHNGHQRRAAASWEGIAFTLLAGIVLGFAVGYGLDRLFGTLPLFLLLGVFAGFAVGLYAVFMETK
ncbi:MAG: AtpZ/AtpI family protein [Thermoleophilia bacterium]